MWAARLRAEGARATVFQVEFDRAALLGPDASAALRLPGDDWPATDEAHVARFATRLKHAADLFRGGTSHCDDEDDEVAATPRGDTPRNGRDAGSGADISPEERPPPRL